MKRLLLIVRIGLTCAVGGALPVGCLANQRMAPDALSTGPFYADMQVDVMSLAMDLSRPVTFSGSHPEGTVYWDLGDRVVRATLDGVATTTSDVIRVDSSRRVLYRIATREVGRVGDCTVIAERQVNYDQAIVLVEVRLALSQTSSDREPRFARPVETLDLWERDAALGDEVFVTAVDGDTGEVVGAGYSGDGELHSVYHAVPTDCRLSIVKGAVSVTDDVRDAAERRGVALRIDRATPSEWWSRTMSIDRIAWIIGGDVSDEIVQVQHRGAAIGMKRLLFERSPVDGMFSPLESRRVPH